ncbi:cysteine-rich CWC family protein [Hydrogenophaga sp.]|uniref:cysteine-rich CWC family protein n=1 Tax=Hydrogenophaga sp. TaxID=1904254 RepID=UPI00286E4C00|nr:cysteine-rich CWC family protein [Hydrogenophaga sp.]
MQTTPAPTDPTRCPLCGGDNRCAMEVERASGQPQPPCWCSTARFPSDLLDRLPAEAAGKACICAACLAAFNLSTDEAQP